MNDKRMLWRLESIAPHELEDVERMLWRIALCDLLHGRWFRDAAAREFARALELERKLNYDALSELEAFQVSQALEHALGEAIQREWLASITEQGLVAWGKRNNRCGPPE